MRKIRFASNGLGHVIALQCSICRSPYAEGGVKGPPCLCPRCYKRKSRKQPEAAEPLYTGQRSAFLTVKVSPKLKREVTKHAKKLSSPISRWIEGLIVAQLGVK